MLGQSAHLATRSEAKATQKRRKYSPCRLCAGLHTSVFCVSSTSFLFVSPVKLVLKLYRVM